MVLVWMRQERCVDPSVPGRDPLVESPHQDVGIGAAVDEHARTVPCLQQDGVALADVQDADPKGCRRAGHKRHRDRGYEGQ